MTDLRQAAQQALDAWDDPAGMKDLCVAMDGIRAALEQQQAEPVGEVIDERGEVDYISYVPPVGTALYTTPPQRQWQGLTDADFLEVCQIAERGNYLLAFQRIQIKLKERNNG